MHPESENHRGFAKDQNVKKEMFNHSMRLSEIDEKSLKEFVNGCTHFNLEDDLEYELPTPVDVYQSYSNYVENPDVTIGILDETEEDSKIPDPKPSTKEEEKEGNSVVTPSKDIDEGDRYD